jgi:arylsulfatase
MKALHVPARAPDGGPMRLGNSEEILPGAADTYASYGLPWANLSNTPFRTYKHWVHEGGIATPLIAHWPSGIKTSGIRRDPGHLIDLMATCIDVAQAKYPAALAGNKIQALEGKSLQPSFEKTQLSDRPIFFEHEANRAVRLGTWKLVSRHAEPWELYDLSNDRSELKNLAAENTAQVESLKKLYKEWATRVHVPAPELVAQKPRN